MVKNLPANAANVGRSLGQEDLWRRARQHTPVFLPGEYQGYSPWGHKESDTTERLSAHTAEKQDKDPLR